MTPFWGTPYHHSSGARHIYLCSECKFRFGSLICLSSFFTRHWKPRLAPLCSLTPSRPFRPPGVNKIISLLKSFVNLFWYIYLAYNIVL
jgi:hypothetical protein